MFRSRWVNNALTSFLIANILIVIGKDNWIGLYQIPLHYLDMLVTFISVFIVFEYIDRITTYLNYHISWLHHFLKRAIIQFALGVVAPAVLAIFLTYLMWEYLWHKGLIEGGYFNFDFVFQVLLMIAINLYFIILFLLRNSPPQKAHTNTPLILGNKGSNKIPVSLDDVACISLRNGIVYLTTFTNEQVILPQNMEYYEKMLPENLFFRANRQFIVHKQACKSFQSVVNGKVEVLIIPTSSMVLVSQKRAAGFRSWIQN